MNNYERIRAMTIDDLAEYLSDKWSHYDDPSMEWWNDNHCSKCESVSVYVEHLGRNLDFAWCELNDNKCKFYLELDGLPNSKEVMKMWLESED